MTLPAETSTNREYSLKCSVTQDAFAGFTSDAITIVPTEGGDEKVGCKIILEDMSIYRARQKKLQPGLLNLVPAVAYNLYLYLHATFTQPG